VYPIEPGTNFLSRARPALYSALATWWTRTVADTVPTHFGSAVDMAPIRSGWVVDMAPTHWPS